MEIQIIEPNNPYNHILPSELFVKMETALIPLQEEKAESLGYKAWFSYKDNKLSNGHWEPNELEEEKEKIKQWSEIAEKNAIYGGYYKINADTVFYTVFVHKKQILLFEYKEARNGSAIDSSGHWYYEACQVSKIKM